MRFTYKSLAIFVLNLKRTNEERASRYPLYFDEKDRLNFELTGYVIIKKTSRVLINKSQHICPSQLKGTSC